jgi:pyrroloquinoline quinone biosynthesis protein B
VLPRTQDSIAVQCGTSWVLVNASPDLRQQLLAAELSPAAGTRASPINEVILSDAELDHVAGLLLLRETTGLRVHATEAVLGALAEPLALRRTLEAYACIEWLPATGHEPVTACDGRLGIDVIPLGSKRPRYANQGVAGEGWVSALRLREAGEQRYVLYAPCVATWTEELAEVAAGCTCVIVDGTFWSDDELARNRLSSRTAMEMGHLPISGPGGSLEGLGAMKRVRRIYTHLNNTNPVLDPSSSERACVGRAGIEVGTDGMVIEP